MKHIIRITETLTRDIVVNADSAQEALESVLASYDDCNIVLSSEDWTDTTIDIVKS